MALENRLEKIRRIVDNLIEENCPMSSRDFIIHLYGVSEYCALLAVRRGLDPEIAAVSGMLHDIYQVTAGIIEKHAVKGAVIAGEILRDTNAFSDEEIEIITTAISWHSKKRKFHEPYDEVLKDADVLSHSLYNTKFPLVEKDIARFEMLKKELGCN